RHFESLIDGQVGSERAEEALPDGLGGEVTGDLATGRSAQAVGDHQKMTSISFVTDMNHRVLIFLPLPPCIRAMSYDGLMSHVPPPVVALRNALRSDKGQISVADAELIVTLKRMRFGDLPPVDESAVARQVVFDQASPVAINDDGVRPADRLVPEQYVAD